MSEWSDTQQGRRDDDWQCIVKGVSEPCGWPDAPKEEYSRLISIAIRNYRFCEVDALLAKALDVNPPYKWKAKNRRLIF